MGNLSDYQQQISSLIEETGVLVEDVFFYENSPNSEEFDKVYGFCRETLNMNRDNYDIKPSYIFFKNNFSINASAVKINDSYIIGFNMGLIDNLVNIFKTNTDLLNGDLEGFRDYEKDLDSPLNVLIHQYATHFTFYHEMAHLIQKAPSLENGVFEHLDSDSDFSIFRHYLELDADEFSSLSLSTHTLDYVERNFNQPSNEQYVKMLIISCSAVFLYLQTFTSNENEIYYKEKSHPHPIIRITMIIFTIVNYFKMTLKRKGIHLEIKNGDIAIDALSLSEKLATNISSISKSRYTEVLRREEHNIRDYLSDYHEFKASDTNLSVFKRNKYLLRRGT